MNFYILIFMNILINSCESYKNEIHTDDIIVTLNPYVSALDKFDRSRYNKAHILEMVKLTSTEFSRLHIQLNEDDLYLDSMETSSSLIPSEVANYNSKHAYSTGLIPLLEVWLSIQANRDSEESAHNLSHYITALTTVAKNANSICNGTVTTLLFPSSLFLNHFNSDLQAMIKPIADHGISKWGIINYDRDHTHSCIDERLIALKPDIILLSTSHISEHVAREQLFKTLEETLQRCKLPGVPEQNVGVLTSCPDTDKSGNIKMTQSITCWKMIRQWARKTRKYVVMNQAFDTPFPYSYNISEYYDDTQTLKTSGWWHYTENASSIMSGSLGVFQRKMEISEEFDKHETTVNITLLEKFTTFKSPHVGVIFSLMNWPNPLQESDKEKISILLGELENFFDKVMILLDYDYPARVHTVLLELRSLSELKGKVEVVALRFPEVNTKKFFAGSIRDAERTYKVAQDVISTYILPYEENHTDSYEHAKNTLLKGINSSSYKFGYNFPMSDCSEHWIWNVDGQGQEKLDGVIRDAQVIYFNFEEDKNTVNLGVRRMFNQRIAQFENCRNLVHSWNPKIEVAFLMFRYAVPDDRDFYSNHMKLYSIVRYWGMLRDWAKETKTTVIFPNAIDAASHEGEHKNLEFGWWRMNRNYGSLGDPTSHLLWIDKRTEALQLARKQGIRPTMTKTSVGRGLTTSQIVIVAVLPLILCCALSGLLLWFMRRHYKQSALLSYSEMQEFFEGASLLGRDDGGESSAHSLPYDKDRYEIHPTDFSIDDNTILGKGEFGMVLKGKILKPEQNICVAIKTTNAAKFRKTALNDLLTEIKVLAYVDGHPNVIKLLGAYTSDLKSGKIYVFLELCHLGSLEKHLRTIRPPPVGYTEEQTQRSSEYVNLRDVSRPFLDPSVVADLHRWSAEIASGMNFLVSKQVVHADLATRNILLTIRREVKISDFGLARKIYNYTNYVKQQQEPMPWRWMPPESLRFLQFNEKSDVWAYGVTLWEMYNLGEQPYPGMSYDINFPNLLERGLRLPEPKYGDEDMYNLMKDCWHINPNRRPTFADLVSRFSDDYDDLFEEN